MGQQQERMPVFVGKFALGLRHGFVRSDRAVAGKHSAPEEVIGRLVHRKLKIAEGEPVGYPLFESFRQIVNGANVDDAFDFLARDETQLHRGDRAEQAVAANGQAEQFGVFGAAARAALTCGVNENERLDVGDKRLHLQPAAMHVGRQGSANRQAVGAGLLLRDAPLTRLSRLLFQQVIDQSRPHDAGVHLDDALGAVERPHAVELRHVEQNRIGGKLLRTHGVTAAGDRHGAARLRGLLDCALELAGGRDRRNLVHPGGIELGMNVVDDHSRSGALAKHRDRVVDRQDARRFEKASTIYRH